MKIKIIKFFKLLAYSYVIVIFLSLIVSISMQFPSFEEVGHLKEGCYWRDALLPYLECRGLILNGGVKFFLNFWMLIVYSVVMFSFTSVYGVLFFLLLWSPLLYLVWYIIKGQHLTGGSKRRKNRAPEP